MFGWKRRRRRGLRARPLPEAWEEVLERRVAHWRLLGGEDRRELAEHIQVFITEKRFEGCGGLELNDEVRVTIAAQACLLLLHRETDYFPGVLSIVVYPSAYWAPRARTRPGGAVEGAVELRQGESWREGAVVLAWDRVAEAARGASSGENVVVHEFAHQLDVESGAADGAPLLSGASQRRAWSESFSRAYCDLRDALARGRPTPLDAYAATSPAEFFAVVTEAFFEQPKTLVRCHPALYAHLAAYFAQEPAARFELASARRDPGEGFWTISIEPYGATPIV